MYPDRYQIVFLACVISASVLVLFFTLALEGPAEESAGGAA